MQSDSKDDKEWDSDVDDVAALEFLDYIDSMKAVGVYGEDGTFQIIRSWPRWPKVYGPMMNGTFGIKKSELIDIKRKKNGFPSIPFHCLTDIIILAGYGNLEMLKAQLSRSGVDPLI